MDPFKIISPSVGEVPIVISVPHCGTVFPPEILNTYHQNLISSPDDTDWFVDRLYDFVGELGITMIKSVYSRWVIDLNRDQKSKPLYSDGRIITGLVPKTDFLGNELYQYPPDQAEIDRRMREYYLPYHEKLGELLESKKTTFGEVLLWEAHSIRAIVPSIYPKKFPDLILGDADGQSCNASLTEIALTELGKGQHSLDHNHPFKGGYITRHFGKPSDGIHALQLEMTKLNYMDDREIEYHEERAANVRSVLRSTFKALIKAL